MRFWLDCLSTSCIVGLGEEGWPENVPVQALHQAYVNHALNHGDRHPLTSSRMGVELRKLCPEGLRLVRPDEAWEGIARPQRYALLGLDEHRKAFLEAQNIAAWDWPVEEVGQ